MSTPAGHTLVGLALARRLGVTSPMGLAATIVAASLPDADIIAGSILHGDPWRMHRKGSHTFGFTLTAGMLAGLAGLISRGSNEGERDLIADALVGAALVSSHVVLDFLPFPYRVSKRGSRPVRIAGVSVVNWLLDVAVYGAAAWMIWPRKSTEA
jgi:membrane-bound metal-dependent hydrolase YbcI (DUF457 family)